MMVSNTLLLLNLLMVSLFPDIESSAFLNPYVMGFNLDAIVSVVAINVISGYAGNISNKARGLCKFKPSEKVDSRGFAPPINSYSPQHSSHASSNVEGDV